MKGEPMSDYSAERPYAAIPSYEEAIAIRDELKERLNVTESLIRAYERILKMKTKAE